MGYFGKKVNLLGSSAWNWHGFSFLFSECEGAIVSVLETILQKRRDVPGPVRKRVRNIKSEPN